LKRYISYAEALSSGQPELAKRILVIASENAVKDALAQSIVTELKKRGLEANRKAGADRFSLGILIDRDQRDKSSDALKQNLLRPEVLKSFGWKILRITAKDWHHDRASVLTQIERGLTDT